MGNNIICVGHPFHPFCDILLQEKVLLLSSSHTSDMSLIFCMTFFLLSVRRSCADAVLPPDARPAAASDKEAAAGGGSGSSCSPAEGRAATRTGHCTAEGKQTNSNWSVSIVKSSRIINPVGWWSVYGATVLTVVLSPTQQVTVQAAQPTQQSQQKVTQLQPGMKTQFFTASIAQAQKPTGAQQNQVHHYWHSLS